MMTSAQDHFYTTTRDVIAWRELLSDHEAKGWSRGQGPLAFSTLAAGEPCPSDDQRMRRVTWVIGVVHVLRPRIVSHTEPRVLSHVAHLDADDEVLWGLDERSSVEAVRCQHAMPVDRDVRIGLEGAACGPADTRESIHGDHVRSRIGKTTQEALVVWDGGVVTIAGFWDCYHRASMSQGQPPLELLQLGAYPVQECSVGRVQVLVEQDLVPIVDHQDMRIALGVDLDLD